MSAYGKDGTQATGTHLRTALPKNMNLQKLLTKYGNKGKLNPETAAKLAIELVNGASIPKAAQAVGVDPTTVYCWMKHSVTFAQCVQEARELRAHTHVEDALDRLANNTNDLYDNGKVIAVNNAQVQRDYRLAEFRYKLAGKFNALYRYDTNAN